MVQWLRFCLPIQGMWVPSLLQELRSHMSCGQNKTKQNVKQKQYCNKSNIEFKINNYSYNCPQSPWELADCSRQSTLSQMLNWPLLCLPQEEEPSEPGLWLLPSLHGLSPALCSSQDPCRRVSLTHQAQAPDIAATPGSVFWLCHSAVSNPITLVTKHTQSPNDNAT